MDLSNPRCEHLASPDIKNFILSMYVFYSNHYVSYIIPKLTVISLIVFGILLSYTPQHVRILTMKTSFGISPYFVLLGTTSGSSALANVISQQQSLHDMACCKQVNGMGCFAGILGILQVGTQCLCFFIM